MVGPFEQVGSLNMNCPFEPVKSFDMAGPVELIG